MPEPRAEVRNAADPEQVKRADRRSKRKDSIRRDMFAAVMATTEGRFVMWELIVAAGVYRSIWDNSARIHYNAGRQDFGHELLATLLDADERSYLAMESEARARARKDAVEVEAGHTASATEGEGK